MSVTTEKSVSINIDRRNVKYEKEKIGVKFNSFLAFEAHITSFCKKASQKLHALARTGNYKDLPKKTVLMKTILNNILIQLLSINRDAT